MTLRCNYVAQNTKQITYHTLTIELTFTFSRGSFQGLPSERVRLRRMPARGVK